MAGGSRPSAIRTMRSPAGKSHCRTELEFSARETGGASRPKPSGTRTELPSARRSRSDIPRVLLATHRRSRRRTRTCLSALRRHEAESHRRQLPGQRAPVPLRSGAFRIFARSSVKHLDGCGLIAGALRQESPQLLPALVLSSGMLGRLQVLCAPMGRDDGREICELLSLQR